MTDMTSCLCRGKADTPQTNENTLHNPTHLERSKARFFFFFFFDQKHPAASGLKTVGLLKRDEASFQLEHPLPSPGRQPPQTECSQCFPKALTCLEPEIQLLYACPLPISSAWPI